MMIMMLIYIFIHYHIFKEDIDECEHCDIAFDNLSFENILVKFKEHMLANERLSIMIFYYKDLE